METVVQDQTGLSYNHIILLYSIVCDLQMNTEETRTTCYNCDKVNSAK